ncbi:MAG: hypothetical protein R3C14_26740 [Caldilineaceae bacterium]
MIRWFSLLLLVTLSLFGVRSLSVRAASSPSLEQTLHALQPAAKPADTAQKGNAYAATPTATPTSLLADGQQVGYENVRFTVPPTLTLNSISLAIVPAPELSTTEQITLPAFALAPEHIHIELVGFTGEEAPRFPAQLNVYPVGAYEALGAEPVKPAINLLHSLLRDRPALNVQENLPYLPLVNAAQIMRAAAQYLAFDGGAGIRYLTVFRQGAYPISNEDLLYTFQGLTDDNRYYVSATFPISATILPDTIAPRSVGQTFDPAQNIAEVTAALNSLAPARFTPDLHALDDLISSLTVAPPASQSSTVSQPITMTQIITFTPPLPDAPTQDGSCWTNSLSTTRADAWRCMAGNAIYDPCFTLPEQANTVVCDANPANDQPGFPLHLTKPLPAPDIPAQAQAQAAVNGWLVLLADGALCNFATGATTGVNGERLNYLCDDGLGLLGDLQPDTVWTANRVQIVVGSNGPELKSSEIVNIRKIWR